jgi:hypothetical protein
MKNSVFRKTLFSVCKQCFEKFFDQEERAKQIQCPDTAVLFKTKLFGNVDFVGELYRRKLLPQATLMTVFQNLLGMSEENEIIDDLVIEGGINLMNKVGQAYEENVKRAGVKKQDEQQRGYQQIMDRFKEVMDYPDETIISNRIKILVKNMFSNRDDGWSKSAEINKGGPKKKIEIQQEVENKYKAEAAARNQGKGYGGDRRDGGYNDRGDRRGDRDRDGNKRNDGYNEGGGNRRQGENRYVKKDTQGGTYGKGGRENRNERERRPVKEAPKEIVEMDDEEMGQKLKKNFEEYVSTVNDQEDIEETEETKPTEAKKYDLSLYDKLKTENGKSNSTIFFNLLTKVFDEDMQKVDKNFDGYL